MSGLQRVAFGVILILWVAFSLQFWRMNMAMAVKLSDNIISEAQIISKALNRSVAGQIEYWAKIGKIAEENPDLTYEFIKNILVAQQEVKAEKLETYTFSKK